MEPSHCKFKISQVLTIFYILLSLKIIFVLTNSVDPDEMLHYVAFHLALHFLPKYAFREIYGFISLDSTHLYRLSVLAYMINYRKTQAMTRV